MDIELRDLKEVTPPESSKSIFNIISPSCRVELYKKRCLHAEVIDDSHEVLCGFCDPIEHIGDYFEETGVISNFRGIEYSAAMIILDSGERHILTRTSNGDGKESEMYLKQKRRFFKWRTERLEIKTV